MRIGFIGTGRMGQAMLPLLVRAGHRVSVWNRSAGALENVEGVYRLDTPAAAFREEVVISMLADDRAVHEVLLSSGALQGAAEQCTHVVMSTLSPALMEHLQTLHDQSGLALVAAPVFGVPAVAGKGELNILAAGPEAAIARVQPLFDVLGKKTWHLGHRPVYASIAKIAGNMMITQAIESLAEATALTRRYGLDAAPFVELMTRTLFACPSYQRYGQNIVEGRYEPGFTLALGLKDIDLAIAAGSDKGLQLPAADIVRSRMTTAIAQGLGSQDWSAFSSIVTSGPPT
ncbi:MULTISPECIES: NAD(P)-dependent oxidoreductase [unclassified Pseudomonas]|uniref:NAD(P)-dependent oxidoreductase n=1 Tax=unclassified Pseudomonas TaxID=196821 RepID=UPI0015A20550|nr:MULTISPECIES: NAD(P)-dependent oxidoreductase [unclassified Pseudomonas]NWC96286.1 NAD(P)-dependent oxidoreductase [Pseudomonas sp. IPO3779]NWD15471.1 NAD(P)-dependent oxidoreductase [Pseudomonas sp. IPO3778]